MESKKVLGLEFVRILEQHIGDASITGDFNDAQKKWIRELYEKLGVATVKCSLCGLDVPRNTAHIHQDDWIGDACCWDERLRSSE